MTSSTLAKVAMLCTVVLAHGLAGPGCGSGPVAGDQASVPDGGLPIDLPAQDRPDLVSPPPDTSADAPDGALPDGAPPDGGSDVAPDLGPIPGERCSMAIELTPGQELGGQDLTGRADDHDLTVNPSADCDVGSGFGGGELVYAISVPAGRRVRVTATPAAGSAADLILALATDCADLAASCLGIVDNPGEASASERLTFLNTSAAPVTVFAVVEPFDVDLVGPFGIRADLYRAGEGDLCASAPALVDGVPAEGDTSPQNDDYDVSLETSDSCTVPFGLDGSDTTYRITVPDQMRLMVTVTPRTGWDAAVSLVTSCESAGPSCLAAADATVGGEPEMVTFDNTTGGAVEVFALVDAFDPGEAGPFTILATLAALP